MSDWTLDDVYAALAAWRAVGAENEDAMQAALEAAARSRAAEERRQALLRDARDNRVALETHCRVRARRTALQVPPGRDGYHGGLS